MDLDLHTSSNGWTAWVTPDPVATNSVSPGDNKFVIVGFLPAGQFCLAPNSFESAQEAQEIISSLDKQTIAFESGDQLVKVFACFDSSYWWQIFFSNLSKQPPQRIYTACNTTEAVALVTSQLSCSTSTAAL
ncbi:hypothetical protein NIES2101_08925 [Calothrix sp. HK-06]|nr:hypothetical protein NIES2101_08925 [Calothrix sp. HK-06]